MAIIQKNQFVLNFQIYYLKNYSKYFIFIQLKFTHTEVK